MKRNSLPPDFFLPPWRSNREFQFLSEDELRIGDCVEYINERTGEFGVRIKIRGVSDPILAWERKIIFQEEEKFLRYMAYRKNDAWRKIRVGNYYPNRAICRFSGKIVEINLYFGLAINGELGISYSIEI